MDQRVWFRAAHRCAARSAHPSRPYPGNERRQLQAQSQQEPLTPCQLGNAGVQSHPGLMPQEKAPVRGALLPASLMYFCSGQLMHFCSGVDTSGLTELVGREEELDLLFRRWSKAKTREG